MILRRAPSDSLKVFSRISGYGRLGRSTHLSVRKFPPPIDAARSENCPWVFGSKVRGQVRGGLPHLVRRRSLRNGFKICTFRAPVSSAAKKTAFNYCVPAMCQRQAPTCTLTVVPENNSRQMTPSFADRGATDFVRPSSFALG